VVVEEMLTAGYIILTLLVAVLFYWLRCRHRFAFGCVEIVVAVVVITFTFVPQTDYLLLNGPSSILGHLLSEAAGLSAGVYIFVRGMDNIAQDLPVGWRLMWHRVFGAEAGSASVRQARSGKGRAAVRRMRNRQRQMP
jgi:hypothetical protein